MRQTMHVSVAAAIFSAISLVTTVAGTENQLVKRAGQRSNCPNFPNIAIGSVDQQGTVQSGETAAGQAVFGRDLRSTHDHYFASSRLRVRDSEDPWRNWCTVSSRTSVKIRFIAANVLTGIAAQALRQMLEDARDRFSDYASRNDQVIRLADANTQIWRGLGMQDFSWEAYNAFENQITFGVMGAALKGVVDFMSQYGWAITEIYVQDGENIVGKIVIKRPY